MAGIISSASNGGVALSAATQTAVLQVRSQTNQRIKVLGFSVAFNGTSATAEPVAVTLQRQSTDGTMATVSSRKIVNGATETLTSVVAKNSTTLPTADGDPIFDTYVHPQGGLTVNFPAGEEPQIGSGGKLGLVVEAPATVSCRATMIIEE